MSEKRDHVILDNGEIKIAREEGEVNVYMHGKYIGKIKRELHMKLAIRILQAVGGKSLEDINLNDYMEKEVKH
jgi:hypothetical protein